MVHQQRGVPLHRTLPVQTLLRRIAGTARWTWTWKRRKSTWTLKRSVTRTIAMPRRVHRDRPPHPLRPAWRYRPPRIHRRNPATLSAFPLFSGRIHRRPTCKTPLLTETRRRSVHTPLRQDPRCSIHRFISKVDCYHLILIIPSRTCIPNCCLIICYLRTCTRCCVVFIQVTLACTRPTPRTGSIIIRSGTSTAASSATRCSARLTDSRWV